jgi:hypothetical protein
MNRFAAAALAIACFFAPPAAAENDEPVRTRLNTLACEDLPVPLKLDVEIMDNAERFLRFKDRFVGKLRAGGAEVVRGAPLTLMLDVQILREFDQAEGGELLEFRAGQESGEDIGREGNIFLRGNVWSNRSDSVLGGRKRDPGTLALNRLHVTATINSRVDGRCLWQGEVRHDLEDGDPDDAAEKIMPFLAAAVGKTVRNRPIDIALPPR